MKQIKRTRPKTGLLFIGAKRFRQLGEGTADGTYEVRKKTEYKTYLDAFGKFTDTVSCGMCYDREDAERAIELFTAEKVDCVCAIFMSWAEDFAWIRFLRELPPMPLLFASVVRDELFITDTNDENQFVEFLSAGALVGAQEGSGSFRRFARPMSDICIGTLDEVSAKLKIFSEAARVRTILRRGNVSLLACYNEAMWATYVDPYNMFMKIGPELHFLSIAQLMTEVDNTPDSLVDELVSSMTSRYRMMPNVDFEKLRASVRASYAMERIALAADADLLVLNDIDTELFRNIGLRPGFTPTTPDLDLVTVPEGDLGGGLATFILQMLAGVPANFIEPFYIDHKRGTFAGGHAGPNNYSACPENVVIARDERFAKTAWKYAGAPFAWYVFPEGTKTMLHMSELNGRMKMICTLVDALPTKHYLASYSHADFKPHEDISPEELFSRILPHGVTQHYGIVDGDWTSQLEALAKQCDFEFARV